MGVLSANGAVAVPTNAEQDLVAIAPGNPLDYLTLYMQGGGAATLVFRLYATVGGVRTLVDQATLRGSITPTIVAWQTNGQSTTGNENIDAGGTTYTVTVRALAGTGTPDAIAATLAGVDEFDTAADANTATAFAPLAAGATGTLATLGGFAHYLDVAISQQNLPPVLVTVEADCGAGSVLAVVKEVTMSGQDTGIASVFRRLELPVATRYFVSVTNKSGADTNLTLTAVTYSVSVTAGGVVVLTGNDNGLSNANRYLALTVPMADANAAIVEPTGWWQVDASGLTVQRTLTLPAAPTEGEVVVVTDTDGSFAAQSVLVNGNGKLVEGGATQTLDAAYPGVRGSVVYEYNGTAWDIIADYALNATGAVLLAGNTNGPNGANTDEHFVTSTPDANVDVATQPHPKGFLYEGLNGLTADRTVFLNTTATGAIGDQTIVKDEDGSLAAHNIIIDPGAGNTIDGAATYTMTAAQNGIKGSVTLVRISATAWALV